MTDVNETGSSLKDAILNSYTSENPQYNYTVNANPSSSYIYPFLPGTNDMMEHTTRKRISKYVNISVIDNNDLIKMGHNHIHIQPVSNGFMITMTFVDKDDQVLCFETFESLMNFFRENPLMDLNCEKVAENV